MNLHVLKFFQALLLNEGLADDVDAEAEEVLNELNLLTETEESGADIHSQGDLADWGKNLGALHYLCLNELKDL
jgi:hypothetical protein